MGDIPKDKVSAITRITGPDELYQAEVERIAGRNRLLTDSIVTVEQIFGYDNLADSWFWITTAGLAGDTVRIRIAAFVDPTATERNIPATDYTFTLTSSEAQKEIALRDAIIAGLNNDTNFKKGWKASSIKDNAIVHISSIFYAEYGERLASGDFLVTTTGTTAVNVAYDNIKRRGKQNSGARDARDKRIVTVGITGSVTSTQEALGDLLIINALRNGSPEMNVQGSLGNPYIFTIDPDSTHNKIITELRFYGYATGIKFGQFLNLNTVLTNGIKVEIKSENEYELLPIIKGTSDLQAQFALGQLGFQLLVGAGPDSFVSSFKLLQPFPLMVSGSYTIDDYIKVTIQDDLRQVGRLRFLAFGYEVDA